MKQDEINHNVQERLRALEAQQQVTMAFLVSIIETHPNRAALQQQFSLHGESLLANWSESLLPEDWIDAGAAFRKVLVLAFDRPSKAWD